MQAAVFLGDRRMELRELPVPRPGSGQVLLRVRACGVCGTDNHIFEGGMTEGVVPPVVLGHEIAATVEAVGERVTTVTPGQFCSVDPVLGCGLCRYCRQGLHNLCAAPEVIGYKHNGGFAQYMVAPAEKVIPMSDAAGDAGGVLCETLACVLRGYDRLGFAAGGSALILGAGTVGLLWAQLLSRSPCRRLVQTEIVPFRRQQAKELGADVVIDPAAGLSEAVRRELGDGADFLIDATGNPAAVQEAFELVAPGGTFMQFGVCPAGSEIRIDPHELFRKEIKVIGSKMPPGTLDRSAEVIGGGAIACERIVTTTLPLADAAEAVAAFNDARDRHIKIAVDPWA